MPTIAWMCGDGPLVEFAAGFRGSWSGSATDRVGVAMQLRLMRQLDRWLADSGLTVGDLTQAWVEQFLEASLA